MLKSNKKSLGYLLLIISISAIVLFVFRQQSQIRELKRIQLQYELITNKFEQLHSNYESNLIQYKRIKTSLDQSRFKLDSITKELNNYSNHSAEHINAIEFEISSILKTIDTTRLVTQPIVNLDSLFNQ